MLLCGISFGRVINIKTLTLLSHEESAASLMSRASMKVKDSGHAEHDAPIVRDSAIRGLFKFCLRTF